MTEEVKEDFAKIELRERREWTNHDFDSWVEFLVLVGIEFSLPTIQRSGSIL